MYNEGSHNKKYSDAEVSVWVNGLKEQANLAARRNLVPTSIADDAVQEAVLGLFMDCRAGKLTPKDALGLVSYRVKLSAINLLRKENTQTCHADWHQSIYDTGPEGDGEEHISRTPDTSTAPVEDTVFLKMELEALGPIYKKLSSFIDESNERIRVIDELAAAGISRNEIASELAERGILNERGNAISPDSVAQDIHRHLTSKFPEISHRWSQRGA